MRLLSSILGGIVVAIVAVLLTLFALENTRVVSLSFLGTHFSGNIWWLVLGAAAIGFLLAMLLVVPGRMVTSHRASGLSRLNAQHQHDLAALHDAHAQLQAERDRLTTDHARLANDTNAVRDELAAARSDRDLARRERDQLRSERDQLQDQRERLTAERDQLRERLAAPPVAPVTADGYRPSVEPALMGAETPAMVTREDQEDQVIANRAHEQAPEEPVMAAALPAVAETTVEPARESEPAMPGEDQVVGREPEVTQPAHPSLREYVRAAFTGQPVEAVQAQDQAIEPSESPAQHDAGDHLVPPAQEAVATPEPEPVPEAHAEAATAQGPSEMTTAQPMEPQPTDTEAVDTQDVQATNAEPERAATAQPAEEETPSLGERLRAVFTGQPVEEVHAQDVRGDEATSEEAQAASHEPQMPTAHPESAEPVVEQPTSPTAPVEEAPAREPVRAESAEASPPSPETQASDAMSAENETNAETPAPSLGDRLRAMFHQPEGEQAPPAEQTVEQPEQPTA